MKEVKQTLPMSAHEISCSVVKPRHIFETWDSNVAHVPLYVTFYFLSTCATVTANCVLILHDNYQILFFFQNDWKKSLLCTGTFLMRGFDRGVFWPDQSVVLFDRLNARQVALDFGGAFQSGGRH